MVRVLLAATLLAACCDGLFGLDRIDTSKCYGRNGADSAGLRMLSPQSSRDRFRFDLAVPLDGVAAGTLRFIGGFESAF